MTPANGGYAVAAYVAAAIVLLSYSMILVARERRLRARLDAHSQTSR